MSSHVGVPLPPDVISEQKALQEWQDVISERKALQEWQDRVGFTGCPSPGNPLGKKPGDMWQPPFTVSHRVLNDVDDYKCLLKLLSIHGYWSSCNATHWDPIRHHLHDHDEIVQPLPEPYLPVHDQSNSKGCVRRPKANGKAKAKAIAKPLNVPIMDGGKKVVKIRTPLLKKNKND